LAPDLQKRYEEQGTIIWRVSNDHEAIDKFRADIIDAFEEMRTGENNHDRIP
jgi:hypothetical protein